MRDDTVYTYTLILTHDADRLSLRAFPLFSKSALSIFKRGLWINLRRLVEGEISVLNYFDSILWCLFYPLVRFGLVDDPWEKAVYDIVDLERKYGARSTFFFIPFPDSCGRIAEGMPAPVDRGVRYDLRKYGHLLRYLESQGWEAGVHGIDAHISAMDAKAELDAIKRILAGKEKIGIRMHWLYKTDKLHQNLREAGFYYDATGETDGSAINQSFLGPHKEKGLWRLPLDIQDGSILSFWEKNFSRETALEVIYKKMQKAKGEGGAVTVLFHTDVLRFPFYWKDIYEAILRRAALDCARMISCVEYCLEKDEGINGGDFK